MLSGVGREAGKKLALGFDWGMDPVGDMVV